MSINVLIVEDERLMAEDISEYLATKDISVVGIAGTSEECFELIGKTSPDVILLDIRLQGRLNGIEVAGIINQTVRIPVIFITAHQDEITIEAAIATNPHSFISKPFNLSDIRVAIELACCKKMKIPFEEVKEHPSSQAIFVKQGMIYKRINIADILYIVADGSYSVFHTTTGDYTVTLNLNSILKQVKSPLLKRIHRSYIVNINKVDSFDHHTLIIQENYIPVSKQYQKDLSDLFPKL